MGCRKGSSELLSGSLSLAGMQAAPQGEVDLGNSSLQQGVCFALLIPGAGLHPACQERTGDLGGQHLAALGLSGAWTQLSTFPVGKQRCCACSEPDPAGAVCSYAGYCPQYKFRLGRTYGKLTSQLLTCPEVARSPHLVLQPTQGPCGNAQPPEQEEKLLEVPRAGWGAGILPVSCSMIPGYTGKGMEQVPRRVPPAQGCRAGLS